MCYISIASLIPLYIVFVTCGHIPVMASQDTFPEQFD